MKMAGECISIYFLQNFLASSNEHFIELFTQNNLRGCELLEEKEHLFFDGLFELGNNYFEKT